MSIYDFKVTQMDGEEVSLAKYAGKPVIIVNTASKCGFAPQLGDLEAMYKRYHDQGLVVLGFPCAQFMHQEFDNEKEIEDFCQVNYGVTFQMHKRIDVRGANQSDLFKYLIEQTGGKSIKWNFTKFLIDSQGNVVKRLAPITNPHELDPLIEKMLVTK
ncbi:glutathione peroxidase [Periweissella cryptocerci]|uniref:Glutathione peroxidase n=1 Tax=Periweissella cryptocerci TaxID=2506420 RepID=A0A4P6YRA9_9LACO|nr:glutathione peroxidase [Periweissella cryptocerci]QBO35167.1 glutathione peroxidase [Periweissella cryptocerci]